MNKALNLFPATKGLMQIADDHHHHQQHINRLSVVVLLLAFPLTHDHQCAQSPNRRLSPPSSFFLSFSSSFFSFPCRLFICTRPPLLRRACQEGGQLTGKSECLLECSVCGAIPASSSPSPSAVIASQPQLHSSALTDRQRWRCWRWRRRRRHRGRRCWWR